MGLPVILQYKYKFNLMLNQEFSINKNVKYIIFLIG